MTNWIHEDQLKAHADGWGVFENSDHGLQIERLDDPSSIGLEGEPRFLCDDNASAHVAIKAAAGDQLARKAIAYIAKWRAACQSR